MKRLGIMQGRLLPPNGQRIQGFPTENWPEEFPRAAEVPLDAIEWIYELQGATENPIATAAGLEKLAGLAQIHRVAIRSVCADYFMECPLIRVTETERAAAEEALVWLVHQCHRGGIERIVLPFVDVSRMATEADRRLVVQILRRLTSALDETGVELHLETDLPPAAFADLLAGCAHRRILANYDMGNSASLGYDPREEFAAYGAKVGSIHVKDRIRGGGTVPLGTGSTDFRACFAEARRVSYAGDFILQVARGASGNEVAWARMNRSFVEIALNG